MRVRVRVRMRVRVRVMVRVRVRIRVRVSFRVIGTYRVEPRAYDEGVRSICTGCVNIDPHTLRSTWISVGVYSWGLQ